MPRALDALRPVSCARMRSRTCARRCRCTKAASGWSSARSFLLSVHFACPDRCRCPRVARGCVNLPPGDCKTHPVQHLSPMVTNGSALSHLLLAPQCHGHRLREIASSGVIVPRRLRPLAPPGSRLDGRARLLALRRGCCAAGRPLGARAGHLSRGCGQRLGGGGVRCALSLAPERLCAARARREGARGQRFRCHGLTARGRPSCGDASADIASAWDVGAAQKADCVGECFVRHANSVSICFSSPGRSQI